MSISALGSTAYLPSGGFNTNALPSISSTQITLLALSMLTFFTTEASADEAAFAECVNNCKSAGNGPFKCFAMCFPSLLIGLKF